MIESNEPQELPNADRTPQLPPVEPPTTGFFLQLFVLPAAIILGILLVWFLFGRLAGTDRSIDEYLRDIASDRKDRWQAAMDLKFLLGSQSAFATDQQAAAQVARALQKALDAGDDSDAQLKEYLAGALGQFRLTTGVSVLRRTARPDQPPQVRFAALVALARLADRLGDLDDPLIVDELRRYLEADSNREVQELSAYLMGMLGDERVYGSLTAALDHPSASVRYNAAAALARLGSPAGFTVLAQMLDPVALSTTFVIQDGAGATRADEAAIIRTLLAALRSLDRCRQLSPTADFSPLVEPVRKLTEHPNPLIRTDAEHVYRRIPGERRATT